MFQALDGGLAMEAGVDFTGGIPEIISLDENPSEEMKKLFSTLSRKGGDERKKEDDKRFFSSSLKGGSGMGLEAR